MSVRPELVLVPAAVVLLVSLAAPVAWLPVLRRLGVVDVPSERSSHTVPTARGVGAAAATALLGGLLVSGALHGSAVVTLVLLVGLAAAAVGLVEDVRGIGVRGRLVLQLALGLGAAAALTFTAGAALWTVALVALAFAGYVNATNFMDGIDGISGAHGLVCGGYFAYLGLRTADPALAVLGAVLAAAFAGFLPWNLGWGRVFLGDCGSYLLGALVVLLAAVAWVGGEPLLVAVAPTLPYLADTGVTLVRRALHHESWWQPHRQHVYQRLAPGRARHLPVAGFVALVSLLCGLAAVLTRGHLLGWATCLLILLVYLAAPRLAGTRPRALVR